MIRLNGISKAYKVYAKRSDRLKEWCAPKGHCYHQLRWALRAVNLEVQPGEAFGLVGMNGAGKSTLLKIITGTLAPTTGQMQVSGRVAALLELGMGFHPELSGRDNAIINGKLLGLNEAEILAKLAAIEDFCELGGYFTSPVRTYSSGMYVRLAFALATSVAPDVLIIDEALSVGDAYFQQKCLQRMREFKRQGTTILFVSHDLGVLKLFCDRVALLQEGQIVACGQPQEILELYNHKLAEHSSQRGAPDPQPPEQQENPAPAFAAPAASLNAAALSQGGNGKALITKVRLASIHQADVLAFEAGQEAWIHLDVSFYAKIEQPSVGILIRDRLGYDVFGINSQLLAVRTGNFQAGEQATFTFHLPLNLGPGSYTLTTAIHQDSTHVGECFQWIDRILTFQVLPRADFPFLGVSLLPTTLRCEKKNVAASP